MDPFDLELDDDLPTPGLPREGLSLSLGPSSAHIAAYDLTLPEAHYALRDRPAQSGEPLPTSRLFEVDMHLERVRIYPLRTFPGPGLLQPKYDQIRCIEIDPVLDRIPRNTDEAIAFLHQSLPPGFVKDPRYGLGLMKEMRPLIRACEQVKGITNIEISVHAVTGFDHSTFYCSLDDYQELRLAFSRISRQYQVESLRDRSIHAHNAVLHRYLPKVFQFREGPYERGKVFQVLGGRSAGKVPLRGRDRTAALSAVGSNAAAIAEASPTEFAKLHMTLELVSLDRFIERFKDALGRATAEKNWQRLFNLNPFMLSMIFGYPVVMIRSQAAVGGASVSGTGAKISDFLLRNETTNAAALVEIKVPETKLLKGNYGTLAKPSTELVAAVVQVLDQRNELLINFANLRNASRDEDFDQLRPAAVDCVLVIGRTPSTPSEVKSLELFRSQLKDVRILTYDEVLGKLLLLKEALSAVGGHEEQLTEPLPGGGSEWFESVEGRSNDLADDDDDDDDD